MDPEIIPAIAHADDQAVTRDWLSTAYEWHSVTTYTTGVSSTYYELKIHDETLLIVHESGDVWVKDGEHGEEVPLGKCHSRRDLGDLVQVLRSIA